jgi:hypothetical protein
MPSRLEYRFVVDAFSPATLPMARLAQYMADLAALLGEPERVHFVRLEEGSAVLVQEVEDGAAPKVAARVASVGSEAAPPDVVKAFRSLDQRLALDNATGRLMAPDGAEVIRFPGRERPRPLAYGSFRQQGSLDGVLIRIGGRDEAVPATLMEGDRTWSCKMTRDMARALAPHLFGAPLRVYGDGRWRRDPEGNWSLDHFVVSHFEVLDDAPWPEVIGRLRRIEGAGWDEIDDPIKELALLRHGDDEPQ